jgi:hypothetical protein
LDALILEKTFPPLGKPFLFFTDLPQRTLRSLLFASKCLQVLPLFYGEYIRPSLSKSRHNRITYSRRHTLTYGGTLPDWLGSKKPRAQLVLVLPLGEERIGHEASVQEIDALPAASSAIWRVSARVC